MKYDLLSKYSLDINNVLKEYPRPQLRRDSYLSLNGLWKYTINNDGNINEDFSNDIVVPYCIESYLSGVRKELNNDEYLIYKKEFVVDSEFLKEITLLHIDKVDQICEVYLNNELVGRGDNGYLPIVLEVSKFIKIGSNILIVKVKDELNTDYPYGKQSRKRGGMWYTPVSGIWGSVWLESVSKNYIKNLKITPNIDESTVRIKVYSDSANFEVIIKEEDKIIYESKVDGNDFVVKIRDVKLWNPDNPFLYDLIIRNECDCIESYFAMRKFSCDNKYFYLNNEKYFVNGVLDQGYFSDGIYTPSSYEMYKDDILKMKELGFNTLRKHIKVEPLMFYYYCDMYGMLVIQDMINVGEYSFLKHTALPTIGVKKNLMKVSEIAKNNFISNLKGTIELLYNTPSLISYTIFNEGWGQFDDCKMYELVKSMDSTRVVDTASGWFKPKYSDVESLHVYFRKVKLKKYNKPIFVSEFGGYSYKVNGHVFNENKEYGYKKYRDRKLFEDGFVELYERDILNNLENNLAGAIYTQVSDVEDEINGLLTYDRKVCKVNSKRVKELMDRIYNKFNEM